MLIILFIPFLILPLNGQQPYSRLQELYNKELDESSMSLCWVAGGTIEQVVPGNTVKGHKCTTKQNIWTADKKQALDYCRSKFPYHIIGAENLNTGGSPQTKCVFQINLKCKAQYWQIHGKCYKIVTGSHTYKEAKGHCSEASQGVPAALNPKVAEYYASNLYLYLREMKDIDSAWVTVSDLKDYFENANGDEAVYLQEGAHQYDAQEGSLIMDSLDSRHQVLCQHDAQMTHAEMLYLAKVYSEIYPIMVLDKGAIIPTASYHTIQQVDYVKVPKGYAPKFGTVPFKSACDGFAKILGADSVPMVALENEWNDVKDKLTSNNFFLTSAFKNDGCSKKNYFNYDSTGREFPVYSNSENGGQTEYCDAHSFSYHRKDRFPTKAAMRASILCTLEAFDWEFGPCRAKPDWIDEVVRFDRGHTTVCHYIINNRWFTYNEAVEQCKRGELSAELSGFDSLAEFEAVKGKLTGTPWYWPATNDKHYFLGGILPCENDCQNRFIASWKEGVATNQSFLNDFNHKGHEWGLKNRYGQDNQMIAFRFDMVAFHSHLKDDYPHMSAICQRTANIEQKPKGVKLNGK